MIVSTGLECDDFFYITTRAFVVSSFSFKVNFDINNRVISTSNLYDARTICRRNESSCSLTRRRNEIFLRSWRSWPVMHNKKKKKEEEKSVYRDFRPRTRTNKKLDTWLFGMELTCNAIKTCIIDFSVCLLHRWWRWMLLIMSEPA